MPAGGLPICYGNVAFVLVSLAVPFCVACWRKPNTREGQHMAVLNEAARTALTSGKLAHMVTLNTDGSPQIALVWVGLDGDEIVSAHLFEQQKLKNVRKDGRVSLSMETGGKNEMGLDHYLVVHGEARLAEGGAPELLQRLAEVYVGPGVKFPP